MDIFTPSEDSLNIYSINNVSILNAESILNDFYGFFGIFWADFTLSQDC